MDSSYAQLRFSEVFIDLGREITLEINSFTDPVVSNVTVNDPEINNQMAQNKWSKNEVLSAMRTLTILKQLKEEVNTLAGQYLPRTEAKIVIDRFNKEVSKARVSIGTTSIKASF